MMKRSVSSFFPRNKIAPTPYDQDTDLVNQETQSERFKSSILHRFWKESCGLGWLLYIIYQVAIGCDHKFNSHSLCPFSDESFPARYWSINIFAFGGLILVLLILIAKMLLCLTVGERIRYFMAVSIVGMSATSTFLTSFFNWGGVCIDTLGVGSAAAMWGEWLVAAPMIVFFAVCTVDKLSLCREDMVLIGSVLLSIIFGFVIVPEQPYALAVFWLILSFLCFLPIIYLPSYVAYYNGNTEKVSSSSSKKIDVDTQSLKFSDVLLISSLPLRRFKILSMLNVVFVMFPINYIIAASGAYGAADTIAVYQILTVLMKGFVIYVIVDIKAESYKEYQKILMEEHRAEVARKRILKYIFHEVRTPLNSLTIGIDLLSYSENLTDDDREAVSMMHNASSIMNNTLNGVLNMQKIEDGELELDLSPFIMKDCIMKMLQTFRGAAKAKKITVIRNIASDIPYKLIGDRFRIEHVISNFLSNAIKFSPENTKVIVNVFCEKPDKSAGKMSDRVSVTVSVADEGPGMSENSQRRLFKSCTQTRPTELQQGQGQGSGMGLSLCKNLVKLHGGIIKVNSALGEGSTFSFTIPFEVDVASPVNRSVRSGISSRPSGIRASSCESVRGFIVSPVHTSPEMMPPSRSAKYFSSAKNLRGSVYTSVHSIISKGSSKSVVESTKPLQSPHPLATINDSQDTTIHASSIRPITHVKPLRNSIREEKSGDFSNVFADNSIEISTDGSPQKLIALVVDDVMSCRKMLAMLLKKRNVASELAVDGSNAVEIVLSSPHTYKLILMDNLMPVMNGVNAARQLRQSGYPYLIVGVTGNVMEDDIAEYTDAGADMVLPKPLNIPKLMQLLEFIESNGTTSRYPAMELVEDVDGLMWAPRAENELKE